MMTDESNAAQDLRGALERGQVQWHCSEEDGGPDVGIMVGLGGGKELWLGELLDIEGGGMGFAVYGPDKIAVASLSDWDDVREIVEQHIAPAMAERLPSHNLQEALERIANSKVAFNAHPVGVITTFQEWARDALSTALAQPAENAKGGEVVAFADEEALRLAYVTGYNDAYSDTTDGMVDHNAAEEGWGQYQENLSAVAHPPAAEPVGQWSTDLINAPTACHVLTARFDTSTGEWACGFVQSPPGAPWTHYTVVQMPDSLATPARTDDAAQPSGDAAAMREALERAYEKVKLYPERNGDPMWVGGQGFMDLLALRNLVPDALEAIFAGARRGVTVEVIGGPCDHRWAAMTMTGHMSCVDCRQTRPMNATEIAQWTK